MQQSWFWMLAGQINQKMQPLQVDLNLEFFFFVFEDMYIDFSIQLKSYQYITGFFFCNVLFILSNKNYLFLQKLCEVKKEHDNYKRKRYTISYSTIYTKIFELR